jgi:hypothetical protein
MAKIEVTLTDKQAQWFTEVLKESDKPNTTMEEMLRTLTINFIVACRKNKVEREVLTG